MNVLLAGHLDVLEELDNYGKNPPRDTRSKRLVLTWIESSLNQIEPKRLLLKVKYLCNYFHLENVKFTKVSF